MELLGGRDLDFDIVLDVTFESFEAMAAYQNDPYHVSVVKKHVHSVKESSVSVDYTIEG